MKTGANCTEKGQVKKVKKVTYKCVKSSGKLKWQIAKKKSELLAPSIPPLTNPEEKPSIVESVQATTLLPFSESDYPLIGKMARDSILSEATDSGDLIEVYWDASTTSLKKVSLQRDINLMNKLYSGLLPIGNKIRLLVIGADKEWAVTQIRNSSRENPEFGSSIIDKFFVASQCLAPNGYVEPDNKWPDNYTTYRGGGGGIVPKIGIAFVTMSNCDNYVEKDILFHETFHALQYLMTYKTYTELSSQNIGGYGTPAWVIEGQAQYMGLRLSTGFVPRNVSEDLERLVPANIGDSWKGEYSTLMNQKISDEYWVGAIMTEYMYAKFGYKKTLSIFEEVVKLVFDGNFDEEVRYLNFDRAFLKIFGQTPSSLFEEAKPYIAWSIQNSD